MNANDFGKRLGIGVRVAARVAQQQARQRAEASAAQQQSPPQANPRGVVEPPSQRFIPNAAEIRQAKQKTHKITRAAGRGIGGFLRPFSRVGGILWLEVTGFFFGMFTVLFATYLWRNRVGFAAGPQHSRFLFVAGLTAVFAYLTVSSFWRAKRK
jgi:hypothetical protein